MKTTRIRLTAWGSLLLLCSCKGTWLMYDTDQKPVVYFQEARQVHVASFALFNGDEQTVETTVYTMGMPSPEPRTYAVEFPAVEPGTTLVQGSMTYVVRDARPGVDFTVDDLTFPAGAVSVPLRITLKRTPEMLMKDASDGRDTLFRVAVRFVENDQFRPCAPDSTRTLAILSPVYYLYVNDGEPACPFWWRDGNSPIGWDWALGKFYPAKYRKFLELFHETEETSPAFFQYCSAAYGYNLDEPNRDYARPSDLEKADWASSMMNKFWRQTYSTAWARFVLLPLYEYYKEYYALHPDDPNWEDMDCPINQGEQVGWASPSDPTWGSLN